MRSIAHALKARRCSAIEQHYGVPMDIIDSISVTPDALAAVVNTLAR